MPLGALIWGANLALAYLLVLRISQQKLLAAAAISLIGLHPLNRSLWFNFGAIYELLALLFLLLTFHAYLKTKKVTKGVATPIPCARSHMMTMDENWMRRDSESTLAIALPFRPKVLSPS